jgi:murein L,D-transpeptidase YafK
VRKKIIFLFSLCVLAAAYFVYPKVKTFLPQLVGSSADIAEVRQRVLPNLRTSLIDAGLEIGSPAFIRVFKEERLLEIWLQGNSSYQLFKTYQICNYSGDLGPKVKEGDRQSPEGFYKVDKAALNPNSSYHLSFNLGFPNAYDQAHSRTGSFLMIHGDCVSVGCYAMTNEGIEEIYLITEAALNAGQAHVPVHAFPFKMTSERLYQEREAAWFEYWENLKVGYDFFEQGYVPPAVSVTDQEYVFGAG